MFGPTSDIFCVDSTHRARGDPQRLGATWYIMMPGSPMQSVDGYGVG
jgi:hypothetical protein